MTYRIASSSINIALKPVSVDPLSTEAQSYLEWFKNCTIPKLPGAFPSDIWRVCLLQASSSEPAVLHAVLALSSAHKRKTLYSGLEAVYTPPDQQEQFMLRSYSTAIKCLQPHLTSKRISSNRIALITCLVFITLEYIRGHYRAGQIHLQNGLQLLRNIAAGYATAGHDYLILNTSPESIDDWITDSFARLQAQSDFFGERTRRLRFVLKEPSSLDQPLPFQSALHARQHLERLIDEIVLLKEKHISDNFLALPDMIAKRHSLQMGLASWFGRYELSTASALAQCPPLEKFAYRLLGIYYTTASIMAACLFHHGESILDEHTSSFLSIINQAVGICKIVQLGNQLYDIPGASEMSSSIADLGWIPPLCFTALKCRHHRIRMQAIKLLSYSLHKEGMWDATLSTSMAKEAVRIEEGTFYDSFEGVDNFYSPLEALEEKDLTLPVLPEEYRLSYIDVKLPEASNSRFKMACYKRRPDGSMEKFCREYDARIRSWVDCPEDTEAE